MKEINTFAFKIFRPMMNDVDWSDKTILVVDDEEVNRFYFKTALKNSGANLLFAHNGKDAVDMALGDNNIDCILMDIRLPILDGYAATRRIREINKEIPIIAQTAFALSNEREKVFEAGCSDYISKPIRLTTLYNTLFKYLG